MRKLLVKCHFKEKVPLILALNNTFFFSFKIKKAIFSLRES